MTSHQPRSKFKLFPALALMLALLLSACGKYGQLDAPPGRDPAYHRPYPPVD